MDLKTFRAANVQEALAMVRRELGPQAAVLSTREVRAPLFGRQTGARLIEVTASRHTVVPSRLPAVPRSRPYPGALAREAADGLDLGQPTTERDARESYERDARESYERENHALPAGENRAPRQRPAWYAAVAEHLARCEVRPDIAHALLEQLASRVSVADAGAARRWLLDLVSARISIAPPVDAAGGGRKIVAIVGPAGVGKTTTVAKLAARARISRRRSVGVISCDEGHAAALEHLRSCAAMLELPMAQASSPDELRQALEVMSEVELIFIDTAGTSGDAAEVARLASLIESSEPTHLLLAASAAASGSHLERLAGAMAVLRPTALVLTRCDEAAACGGVLTLLEASRLSVAYLSTGRRVPDDLAYARAPELARMVLGMR